jgi:hypothetical protein
MSQPEDKPRDWDKELAEVDRLLAKLPHADPSLGRSPKTVPAPGAKHIAPAPHAEPAGSPQGRLGVWIRVGLALLVGVGMVWWPYTHACGLKLMFYFVGAGAVLAGSIWGALGSWRHRMGFAHALSVALLVWGVSLVTSQILPRVGPRPNATWFCPEPTPGP